MALAYKGMSQASLARAIGTTPSNFNQKFKRGTFTVEELEKMWEAEDGEPAAAYKAEEGFDFMFDLAGIEYGKGEKDFRGITVTVEKKIGDVIFE